MIKKLFISVGTRFTMDRLIFAVDNFLENNKDFHAFAQIGDSNIKPNHIKNQPWLSEIQFQDQVEQCDIFISHAGMGNIILAAEYNKPIIIMPRKAELQEHINNHQLGTVKGLNNYESIFIVNNKTELADAICMISDSIGKKKTKEAYQSRQKLVNFLENYLN